ncbi:hypothetical protein [Bacillus thuringiensis]|nr:hypothetical protein [Bacillus thuringiensis]
MSYGIREFDNFSVVYLNGRQFRFQTFNEAEEWISKGGHLNA